MNLSVITRSEEETEALGRRKQVSIQLQQRALIHVRRRNESVTLPLLHQPRRGAVGRSSFRDPTGNRHIHGPTRIAATPSVGAWRRGAEAERRFVSCFGPRRATQAEADHYIAPHLKFDEDLWIIEIEDREGRHFLGESLIPG